MLIGKFPIYVLQFSIPPALVDVNVHPAKLEVRFHNDDEIYQMFYEAVCKTFENEVLISKSDWNSKNSKEVEQYQKEKNIKIETTPIQQKILEKEVQQNDFYFSPKQNKKIEIPSLKSVDNLLKNKNNTVLEAKEDIKTTYVSKQNQNDIFETQSTQNKRTRDTFFKNYKIIGQIFNTYWIIEQSKSIFMIDQHAAHERILYEELMTQLKQKKVISQMLLQPLLLNLTEKEKEILQQNRELLKQFGFSIEEVTPENYALLSVPFIIKAPTNTKFFLDILDLLEETMIENVYDTKVLSIATMACKAAVKGNDKLSITEATAMIEKLLQLENPFTCPHGRPTIIEMTQYELEKRFKRIQN